MQIAFAKIAVIASLLFPAINIAKTTTVFGAVEKSESYSFTLNALSDVSIGYKWTDLLVVKNGKTNEFNASSIIWTLTNTTLGASTTALTGSFADVSGQTIGKDTLSLTGLSAGTYSLNLAGQWACSLCQWQRQQLDLCGTHREFAPGHIQLNTSHRRARARNLCHDVGRSGPDGHHRHAPQEQSGLIATRHSPGLPGSFGSLFAF